MRHNVKTKKIAGDMDHKKALRRNLAGQLILHEELETTLAKAKLVRPYVEKLITKAKNKSGSKIEKFNTVKYLRKKLYSEEAIRKVIEELGNRYKDRKGGYTRIVRIGNRDGDNAVMGRLELLLENKKSEKGSRKAQKNIESEVKETDGSDQEENNENTK